ncbi:MAG: hypothetical protein AMXMBFR60_25940 [Chloroflexota bacterium]
MEAFQQWADLIESAKSEVAFTVMFWDDRHDTLNGLPYPGEIVLQGVQNLHEDVINPIRANEFPRGMTVRILVGVQYNKISIDPDTDQRFSILEELRNLNIPVYEVLPDGRIWKVEVGLYKLGSNDTKVYSHVKLLVVDNNKMIVSGYMPTYPFRSVDNEADFHDLGIEVSGPIAANGMAIFDKLWEGSAVLLCQDIRNGNCHKIGKNSGHWPFSPVGEDIVLPLYRDTDDKTADLAIQETINAADEEVYVLQNRVGVPGEKFVPLYKEPVGFLEYATALQDVVIRGKDVRILFSQDTGNFSYNQHSSENFIDALTSLGWLGDTDQFRFYAPYGINGSHPGLHAKVFIVDGNFLVVGSQNFDHSAFGDYDEDLDLVEYSIGIENSIVVSDMNNEFVDNWNNSGKLLFANQENLEAVIQTSEPGDVILADSGVYEISNTINIKEGVTLSGSDIVFRPSLNFSGESLLRINDDNVSVFGIMIQASSGYGLVIGDGTVGLKNVNISGVTFINNQLGGIHIQSPTDGSAINYTIENNTFIGNDYAITLSTNANSTGVIRNNIFAGQNIAPIQIASTNDGTVEYAYNLFYDCNGGDCSPSNWKIGNLGTNSNEHDNLFDLNPLFANPANGNYQLSANSPAVDAGDPSILHEFLFDGNGDGIPNLDLGAFEYVDTNLPSIQSITRNFANPTNVQNVEFTVAFSKPVENVDIGDFALTTTGVFGAVINSISGSGSEYTITVDTGYGNGTIRLDIPVDASISDFTGNQLTGLPYTSGESYTVTKTTLPFEGDEFNGPDLAEGWQWYVPNPGPTYSLSAAPGALRMSLPIGGYFERWGTDDYAPQLKHIGFDNADWAVETRLENINASVDAGYWAALAIGFDQYDQVWFGISDGDYLQELRTTDCCSASLPAQDVPIMLRVEKLGENYTFLYKHDTDIDWTELSTRTYVGTPVYVGLIGRSWNTGSDGLEFDWSYFHIEPWFAPLTVSSVTRDDLNPTNAGIAHFTVNFSEAVTGVDINDFALTTSGLSGTAITNVSGSGNSYTVAVQTGNGEGTLRLDVLDNDMIINSASRSLENGFTEGESYTMDRTAPSAISIVRASPNPTNQTSVGFTIDFSENVTGVDLSDFTLATSGISGATLNGVSGIDNIYAVIVNTGSGNGAIRLNIADNDTIIDALGNPLGGVGIGNGSFTTGEAYTVDKNILLSVTSAAAQDGYVRESTETSNAGGSVNTAATTFFVGDDVQDRQYLSLLSFGTSGLPDNAVIVSATLKLKLGSAVGTSPFTTHNSLVVDIRQPYFGTAVSLQTNDFAAVAGAGSVATVGSIPQSGYYIATINSTGLTHISKTGATQLRLRFLLDDNDDLGADYLAFYSANASPSSNRPVLEIVYYVP